MPFKALWRYQVLDRGRRRTEKRARIVVVKGTSRAQGGKRDLCTAFTVQPLARSRSEGQRSEPTACILTLLLRSSSSVADSRAKRDSRRDGQVHNVLRPQGHFCPALGSHG